MKRLHYLSLVAEALSYVTPERLERLQAVLQEARDKGRMVFCCGNGGSAATAAHFAVDLQKQGVRAISLTEPAALTATSNDTGYCNTFALPLRRLARPLDVLVCISVSGGSANVLTALEMAYAARVTTLLLTGRNGAGTRADHRLVVESDDYGVVEDCHLAVCHALARGIQC